MSDFLERFVLCLRYFEVDEYKEYDHETEEEKEREFAQQILYAKSRTDTMLSYYIAIGPTVEYVIDTTIHGLAK